MKKRIKKRRFYLIRPADALLPLAFLLSDLFCGSARFAGCLVTAWIGIRALGLFTADSVRMAFATQPGMRQVKGSTTLSLLMQILGAGIAAALCHWVFRGLEDFQIALIGIGLALNIEHVFVEYLRAAGCSDSADRCSALTAGAVLTGMLLESGLTPVVTAGTTGLACIITAAIAVIEGGYRPVRMNMAVLGHAPRAMLYGLAYPAVFTCLLIAFHFSDIEAALPMKVSEWIGYGEMTGFYAGLALLQTVKTPFRRSGFESRTLIPTLAGIAGGVCALCAILWFFTITPAHILACACAFALSVICAVIVALVLWGSFSKEEY